MKSSMPREFYIPKGSKKVSHKQSQAVAYAYERLGKFYAVLFYGKRSKPEWHYSFKSEEARASRVASAFASFKEWEERKQKTKEEFKSWIHGFEPGDIFKSSWGYDQTNIDYYEVISVSKKMLTVCQIKAVSSGEEGFMTARCVPAPGEFKGKPFKVLAQCSSTKSGPKGGYFKVASYANAYYMKPEEIGGVKVYEADRYSWYA